MTFTSVLLVSCGKIDASLQDLMPNENASLDECAEDELTTGPCAVNESGLMVSRNFGSSISTWANATASTSVSATIPNGVYVNRSVQFAEPQLTPANIVNGVSIFGVTGTASGPYAVCVDDTLNASQCSTDANRYVTATAGANVTSWSNASATTTVTASIPLGYYSGLSCQLTDANLTAGNIKSGVTVFGVGGTYTGIGVELASNMHRDKTTTQITQYAEAVTNAGTDYGNANPGYRAVPRVAEDDEGYSGGSVTFVNRTGWDTTCDSVTGASGGSANSVCTCGSSGTLAQRISHCAAHGVIGPEATWNGPTKGNAGQGVWRLVTRTGVLTSGMGREVWRDERTGLLWSSLVSTGVTWCKATGSNNIALNPAAEDDPSNLCDNALHQNTAGKAISACFEDDGTYFTQTDAGIDPEGIGGLSRSSTPMVAWRVPTIYDFGVANVNGIRFVMPDMLIGGISEWSATIRSSTRSNAWVFNSDFGFAGSTSRSGSLSVRCVGR